jgi:hypothetical protein
MDCHFSALRVAAGSVVATDTTSAGADRDYGVTVHGAPRPGGCDGSAARRIAWGE